MENNNTIIINIALELSNYENCISMPQRIISEAFFIPLVKTRLRVLRAGFGSALADKFLTESVRILAERFNSFGVQAPTELKYWFLSFVQIYKIKYIFYAYLSCKG